MKIIFLDFDGVVTAKNGTPGSYMTHGPEEYGPTPVCVNRLMKLVKDSGAKIVISSNWRKFDVDGPGSIWENPWYGGIKNPLPGFIPMLGDAYLESLPAIHLCKAAVADYWLFKKTDVESFIALDDMCGFEGYDRFETFKDRYINTDPETGLTDEDCRKALEILSRPFSYRNTV